ncbi:hypothetical protein J5N97_008837 [Dioscorea zingiberensis]|uniref:Uncharacterized protein n=1 Tax=Dioscorea zingiberensis TaxID=325984 RepID=A0A9D5HLR7_9LILI|nr:hypothetical protein J5N97_008837 [Dioscorea zingiberensis]
MGAQPVDPGSESQPMNIAVAGQGSYERNNPKTQGQKEPELAVEDNIETWKIAGSRRGRGQGRGPLSETIRRRRRGSVGRFPGRFARFGDRHVGSKGLTEGGRSSRGGRGGYSNGKVHLSRGSVGVDLTDNIMSQEWPPLASPNCERRATQLVAEQRSGAEVGSQMVSKAAAGETSYQLAVDQTPGVKTGMSSASSSGMAIRRSPELITSYE